MRCLFIKNIQYRYSTLLGVRQATKQENTTSTDDESSQLFDLATSILEECKKAAPLSDLNTAIYLFREALDRHPVPHPLRLNSLKDLAGALSTRFSLTNQIQDLDQSLSFRTEMMHGWYVTSRETGGQSQFNVSGGSVLVQTFAFISS